MRLHPPFPRAAAGAPARPRWVRRLVPVLFGSVLVTLIMCCAAAHGGPGDAHRHTPKAPVADSANAEAGPAAAGSASPGSGAPGEEHSAAECAPGAIPRLAQPVTGPPVLAMAVVTLRVAVVLSSVPLPAAPGVRGPPMRRYGRAVLTGLCRWRV